MESMNRALLEAGLRSFGLEPEEQSVTAIGRHLAMVADWNERVNLTALTNERDMVLKHAIDSASAVRVISLSPGLRVLDVGTGAGFPGVTLKCLAPDIHLVLLESLQKRCRFLEAVKAEVMEEVLGTSSGYEVVWGRAEDQGHNPQYREKFDVVCARAVAELRVLAEYCLPFCRVGGEFLAMKGPAGVDEVAQAEKAIEVLGGVISEVKVLDLPEEAGRRTLVRIKKERHTPMGYPRKAGTPAKSPL